MKKNIHDYLIMQKSTTNLLNWGFEEVEFQTHCLAAPLANWLPRVPPIKSNNIWRKATTVSTVYVLGISGLEGKVRGISTIYNLSNYLIRCQYSCHSPPYLQCRVMPRQHPSLSRCVLLDYNLIIMFAFTERALIRTEPLIRTFTLVHRIKSFNFMICHCGIYNGYYPLHSFAVKPESGSYLRTIHNDCYPSREEELNSWVTC